MTGAFDILVEKGVKVHIVSMPSMEVFKQQSQHYRDFVLPRQCRARVAIECAGCFGRAKYVGLDGEFIGMSTLGESAPMKMLMEKYDFTPGKIAQVAEKIAASQRWEVKRDQNYMVKI